MTENFDRVVLVFVIKDGDKDRVAERVTLSSDEFRLFVAAMMAHLNFLLVMCSSNPMMMLLNKTRIEQLTLLWEKMKKYHISEGSDCKS